jgi:hypothetical protein
VDTKKLKPHQRLEIVRNEDAEQLKARVVARIEALLSEKYLDLEELDEIFEILE